jgi:hypothetical protein
MMGKIYLTEIQFQVSLRPLATGFTVKNFFPGTPIGLLALLALMVCIIPATAFAYIDPGTGSFVIQGIIAAIVGAGVAIKMFWHRIGRLFGGKAAEDDEADD